MTTQGIIYNIQRMSLQDGPGLRTTVFFKGCPLRCRWCSNPESQAREPQLMFFHNLCVDCGRCLDACIHGAVVTGAGGIDRDFARCVGCGTCAAGCPASAASMSGRVYSVDQVMRVIRKDASFYVNSGGGVTFSGGECTAQPGFLLALIDACHAEGLHACVDTCGHTDPRVFARLMDVADLFLFDIKQMDSEQHRRLTGVGNELIQRNLRAALAACPEKLRIRVPLMPGLNDSDENILAIGELLDRYGVTSVDILPCHTFGGSKYEALNLEQPGVPEYTPDRLHMVLGRFMAQGLATQVL